MFVIGTLKANKCQAGKKKATEMKELDKLCIMKQVWSKLDENLVSFFFFFYQLLFSNPFIRTTYVIKILKSLKIAFMGADILKSLWCHNALINPL